MPMPAESFWSAATVLVVVIGQILNVYWRKLLAKDHTIITTKLDTVVEQTDGINKALQATVKKQDSERVSTAKTVEHDKKAALKKKEK